VLEPPHALRWADVPTGGQKFGEDVRFVKVRGPCQNASRFIHKRESVMKDTWHGFSVVYLFKRAP
jgi:hypothetical protein